MSAYETNIPGGSIYAGAALLAKTAYQKALARLNQQRGTTIRNAGFKADIDPETGMVKGLGVDQTSMYGDFQQLNRQQAQRDEQARWGAQERGLGSGGGLAAQLRNNVRYDFGAQDAKLGTDLAGALAGFSDQQVQYGQQRDAALYEAQLAAAREAQQNEMWSPTDYGDMELPEYGETAWDEDPGMANVTATPIMNQRQMELAAAAAAKKAKPKPKPKPKTYSANSFYMPVAPKPAAKKKILPTPKKKKK